MKNRIGWLKKIFIELEKQNTLRKNFLLNIIIRFVIVNYSSIKQVLYNFNKKQREKWSFLDEPKYVRNVLKNMLGACAVRFF